MGIYVQIEKDIIAFGAGSNGKITDKATVDNLNAYLNLNTEKDIRLKKYFFAVLLHGSVNGTSPGADWGVNDLCSEINKYWNKNEKPRRALLMISCLTGYGLARQVSRQLSVPVVAPQSFAYINDFGGIMSAEWNDEKFKKAAESVKGYNIQQRPYWVLCDLQGNITRISEFSGLDKDKACNMVEIWSKGK